MSVAGAVSTSTPTATSGVDVTYLKHNSGDDVLGGISAGVLVNNLPADLRPDSSVAFYADPVIEQQLLTQAALQQTGQAYFVNGLSADDQTKASVADQQKDILYSNAVAWAETNDVQLGTALSQDQIAGLTAPMLWYVEEAVPDPACTGQPTCGTVNVLMPQVYLPDNQAAKQEGGSITGNNVTLTLSGSLTNTGTIAASNDLNIAASSITNEARSVDIGQSAYKEAGGWLQVSGTQVQPGGFISGANVSLTTDAINNIGGTFQVTDPATGQVDAAASAQLIQDLGAKLGVNYTQTSVSDNINQSFIKDTSGPGTVVVMIAAIVIAVLTYGAASELVAAAAAAETGTTAVGLAATGSTFAAATATTTAGLANAAIAAGAAGMASTATSELLTTGKLDGDSILKAGLVGALTAGITGELGIGSVTGGGLNNLGTNLVNAGERSLISAGLDTAVYGTSFGTAFEQSLAANAGASLNGAIGDVFGTDTSFGTVDGTEYEIAHAALGCAMGALSGGSCSAGAIGGLTSAVIAQPLDHLLANSSGQTNPLVLETADLATTGLIAGLMGKDALTAMNQAQNEVENNYLNHTQVAALKADLANAKTDAQRQQILLNYTALSQSQSTALTVQNQLASDIDSTSDLQAAGAGLMSQLVHLQNQDLQTLDGRVTTINVGPGQTIQQFLGTQKYASTLNAAATAKANAPTLQAPPNPGEQTPQFQVAQQIGPVVTAVALPELNIALGFGQAALGGYQVATGDSNGWWNVAFGLTNAASGGVTKMGATTQPASVMFSTGDATSGEFAAAGSVKSVNPTGSMQNCTNCVFVVDNQLATGTQASALPMSKPLPFDQLNSAFNTQMSGWTTQAKIEQNLLSSGDGTSAVVYGMDANGATGHVWNAVVQNGKINYIDGQIGAGGAGNFQNFPYLQFGIINGAN